MGSGTSPSDWDFSPKRQSGAQRPALGLLGLLAHAEDAHERGRSGGNAWKDDVDEYVVSVEDEPDDADMQVVEDGLNAFVSSISKLEDLKLMAVLLRDGERRVVGGALGWTKRGWLEINVVWVREDLRGQGYGPRLMRAAEDEARARGCHSAYLNTFSFQAPGFYEKLGYEAFGVLDGYSGEHKRYHFQKRLR